MSQVLVPPHVTEGSWPARSQRSAAARTADGHVFRKTFAASLIVAFDEVLPGGHFEAACRALERSGQVADALESWAGGRDVLSVEPGLFEFDELQLLAASLGDSLEVGRVGRSTGTLRAWRDHLAIVHKAQQRRRKVFARCAVGHVVANETGFGGRGRLRDLENELRGWFTSFCRVRATIEAQVCLDAQAGLTHGLHRYQALRIQEAVDRARSFASDAPSAPVRGFVEVAPGPRAPLIRLALSVTSARNLAFRFSGATGEAPVAARDRVARCLSALGVQMASAPSCESAAIEERSHFLGVPL